MSKKPSKRVRKPATKPAKKASAKGKKIAKPVEKAAPVAVKAEAPKAAPKVVATKPSGRAGRLLVYVGDDFLGRLQKEAGAVEMTLSDHLRTIVASHFGETYQPTRKRGQATKRLAVPVETVEAIKSEATKRGVPVREVLREKFEENKVQEIQPKKRLILKKTA